jgi:hypothetical protein
MRLWSTESRAFVKGIARCLERRLPALYDHQRRAFHGGTPLQILAVHEAHEDLELHDPVKAKLVELRFFVGLLEDLAHHGRPGLVIRPRRAVRRRGRRDRGEKLTLPDAFGAPASHGMVEEHD